MLSLVLACTLAAGARAAVLPRDVAVAIFAKQSTVDDERGAIAGQCATWVRSLGAPAAIFTDVARRAPAACASVAVRECCPGNASLGRSRAAAQYKREVAHARVLAWLEATGSAARWILETEYDTWFDGEKLLDYLSTVERGVNASATPAVAGNWQGPFTILSRPMLRILSDRGFADVCRHHFLKCRAALLAAKSRPSNCRDVVVDGTVPGAAYNDDQLLAFCAGRVAGAAVLHPPGPASDCRETGLLEPEPAGRTYVAVHNRGEAAPDAAWTARPELLLAFHHVDADGMARLEGLGSGRRRAGVGAVCRKANVADGLRERRGARRRRRFRPPLPRVKRKVTRADF